MIGNIHVKKIRALYHPTSLDPCTSVYYFYNEFRFIFNAALLDEDIKNDLPCAMKVFETQGFKYWPKWEARCKGQVLPDIEK